MVICYGSIRGVFYSEHLQLHNGRSGIGVMITVSNRDPLDYPAGVTGRWEDVHIGP